MAKADQGGRLALCLPDGKISRLGKFRGECRGRGLLFVLGKSFLVFRGARLLKGDWRLGMERPCSTGDVPNAWFSGL